MGGCRKGQELSGLKTYSQILEFIKVHDFFKEIKFYFFKYSFEGTKQLQQGCILSIIFKTFLFSPVFEDVGQAGQLQNDMSHLGEEIVVESRMAS